MGDILIPNQEPCAPASQDGSKAIHTGQTHIRIPTQVFSPLNPADIGLMTTLPVPSTYLLVRLMIYFLLCLEGFRLDRMEVHPKIMSQ
jgi:hypothetical protein